MIAEVLIKPDLKCSTIKHCVIALAGRSNPVDGITELGLALSLPDTLVVGVRPYRYEWYPQPTSAVKQTAAVAGLPVARAAINDLVAKIRKGWGLQNKNIALVGYSAGGVMVIETAVHKVKPFAAAVSFCGAILEPQNTPVARSQTTPIMLIHNQDDACFDWEERYLPTRNVLQKHGYDVTPLENRFGGHHIDNIDIMDASNFIGLRFGYKNWQHPRYSNFQ